MAAIIVEDGTIVTGANSYVSEIELTTFATDRGITLTANEDVLLIKAMDYIDTLAFKGYKYTQAQALQWPRSDVSIDGYYVSVDAIPTELKNALMQTAVAIDEGDDPLGTLSQAVARERVDVIEVEYATGSTSSPIIKKINAYLKKLLVGGSGGNVVNVGKA